MVVKVYIPIWEVLISVSARTPVILNEIFRDFLKTLETNDRAVT
jgi:hypothetical protein